MFFCCEDHFNLEQDMENYVRFKLMGGKILLKTGVIPHIFDCQQDRKRAASAPERSLSLKRERKRLVEEAFCSDQPQEALSSDQPSTNSVEVEPEAPIMNSDSSDEEYNPGKDNRTARKSTIATPPTYSTRRQAARNASKAISASSFDKSMEKFNPDLSQREKRKLNKKFNQSTVRKPNGAVYDEKGRHVSGVDLCDCLNEKCPGCWFECPKCESNKCGTECRVFRKYIVDSIEYHGYDKTVRNNLALRS
ncbi:uncharacterized protein LOC109546422 isoform X2 [Dendroctonus ponderosae]|nr:uncharacterized protein LOC109546422 isoform X2 [Dendroctonus ponderosae]